MTGIEVPKDFMYTADSGFCLKTGTPKIGDIAHALGMQCRYNGSVRCFYSVAQHCVMVSKILEDQGYDLDIQLLGLLHDAAEAYTGDITVPIQRIIDMDAIKKLEWDILLRIWDVAEVGGGPNDVAIVKAADRLSLRIEIRDLINETNPHREVHDFASLPRQYSIQARNCMLPRDATQLWLVNYRRLQVRREEASSECVI